MISTHDFGYCSGVLLEKTDSPQIVVTLGVFDGCHRGHRELLAQLKKMAQGQGAVPTVVTFDPHPDEVLHPERAQQRLFLIQDNVDFLKEAGASEVRVLPFDQALAELTPQEFLTTHICTLGAVKGLVIGHDFALGRDRLGDGQFLRDWCAARSLDFYQVPPLREGEEIISTSQIRHKLNQGLIEDANALMGRRFFLRGQVVEGQKLGRKLGFPTANLALHSPFLPAHGVYLSRVRWQNGEAFAATNIGVRPTVAGKALTVESHLLDVIDLDLYNEDVVVEFWSYLRGERRFAGLPELQEQIRLDLQEIRRRIDSWPQKDRAKNNT